VIAIENVHGFPAGARGAFVTIGNFDGVHRGHQALLGRLRALADAAGAPAMAITFDPHPATLLRPAEAPVPLVWPEREVELLIEAGATEVGVFRTGPWLLELSAREFFDRVIRDQLAARGLVEGPNFAFGRDREGTVAVLRDWCAAEGIAFEVVEGTRIDEELVSSSRIRRALVAGDVEEATRLLGRPHRIRGAIGRGAGRGSGLGFPTANLVAIDTLIPADGVYAARAHVDGRCPAHPAACNIGPNPTFGEDARKVEAHLLGFSGDLYNRRVELDFIKRLRATRRFSGLDELILQVRADIEETRLACQAVDRP
jgi:riboflavin kinase / FMN adenylyltransferase